MKISKEFKVGIFAVVAIVLLYFGFNFLKGIELFERSQKFYAFYENIDGLNVSNPVIVNGFNVGRVSDIEILQKDGNQVLVEMTINENIIVGDTSIAVLINSDFLGSKAIKLEIGSVDNPAENYDTLRSKLDRGIIAMLEASVDPVADNISITIKKINTVLDQLAGNSEKINETVGKVRDISYQIDAMITENRSEIKYTIQNLEYLTQKLDTTFTQVNVTLREFQTVADTVQAYRVNETLGEVNTTLKEMQSVLANLKKQDNTLGRLMTEDSLYMNLNQTMIDLNNLINHINKYPKHFFGPLGKKNKKVEKRLSSDEEIDY